MYQSDVEAADAFLEKFKVLKKEISKKVIGQEEVIDQVLISVFAKGHALLVGVPGLAKTLMINTISESMGLSFNRIQFTPDLMPSDIIGAEILDESRNFKFLKGPIFSNIVLADEINRTPPKTQAALLEAMQERSVTVSGKNYLLDNPFFVLATQNPIEQEGTYPLPEAQLDRFMFNILVKYPTFEEELSIVNETTGSISKTIENVISADEIVFFQNLVRKAPIASNVVEYAVNLSSKTRPKEPLATEDVKKYISWGAGPRASQFLVIGAKCHALVNGKYSPDIEDVKAVAKPILRHRIVKNYIAEADGMSIDGIIDNLL
ncbi:MAG: MoxR family ATPase [Flavobacteriales bacterium]|jgi:MoxR-like ATPase|nr:MoxR family ATPase [Flavobacteriales bacterium]MDG1439820.1 MoxR family ATPase [Flavobacteriales bacterium]MDG1798004.1 MoxR family ATPase [Flavobacteriales bacterium]